MSSQHSFKAVLALLVLMVASAGQGATCADKFGKIASQGGARVWRFASAPSTEAFQRWSRVSTETPEIPYFALALDSRLDSFAQTMYRQLRHDTVTYRDHVQPPRDMKVMFKILEFAHSNSVPWKMARLTEKYPGRKFMLFNLDGFDMDQYRLTTANGGKPSGMTNQELHAILSDTQLFDHVRWYRGGKELTFEELNTLFRELNPDLF